MELKKGVDVMYGAILGDIIGSRFEFDRGGKTKEFDLFTDECSWTDDTVLTVAVADALMKEGPDADIEKISGHVRHSLRKWGRKYPNAGFGGSFYRWLFTRGAGPYNSYGNGSAMRTSAVGWLYDSLERTREVAAAVAAVTHNHPEGIKGAECTSSVIFMARTGVPKKEIREYVIREFGYDLSESLEQLRARHEHIESCQDSLPKALAAFFEGEDFEDVVRNAVSLGGDTDTLGAIAGAMGEAMYGIPAILISECKKRVPEDMREVLQRFDSVLGYDNEWTEEDSFSENKYIKLAADILKSDTNIDNLNRLLGVLAKRMDDGGQVHMPVIDVNHTMPMPDPEKVRIGESLKFEDEVRLRFDELIDQDENHWLPLFTDDEEIHFGKVSNIIINVDIEQVIRAAIAGDDIEGLVINPFGASITLNKDILKVFMDTYDRQKH